MSSKFDKENLNLYDYSQDYQEDQENKSKGYMKK